MINKINSSLISKDYNIENLTSIKKNCSIKVKKEQILLVDDNEILNDSAKNIVNKIISKFKLDLDVICLSDGVEVIKYILDEKNSVLVKCIITDENMEYINGSETIKFLKNLEFKKKLHKIIIISLTSYDDKKLKNEIISSGADQILNKPISENKLEEIFRKLKIIN